MAGRALGKLVLNLELDMVNRVLKLCLSIQSATQSGANIYLYKNISRDMYSVHNRIHSWIIYANNANKLNL